MATFDAFTLQNEREFDRELMVLAGGGLLSGLVVSGLHLIAGAPVAELSVLGFAAILGLLANLSDARKATPALRLGLAIVAGVSMALLLQVHLLVAGLVGGVLLGATLALEAGNNKLERLGVWGIYGLCLVAAFFTTDTLFTQGPLAELSVPVVGDMIRGGVWAMFLALACGVRQVRWARDEIRVEFDDAIALVKDEKAARFLGDARATYTRIREELQRDEQGAMRERAESISEELARGVIGLTRRAADLRRSVERQASGTLERRAAELEARIGEAHDPALKRELVCALQEIVEQMRVRKRLEVAVVRVEARQQRYLTGLERLHVTLVHNDSISSDDPALQLSLENLSRLTDEVRWKDLSVEELLGVEFQQLEELNGGEAAVVDEDEELDELLAELHTLSGVRSGGASSLGEEVAPARARRVVSAPEEGTVLDVGAAAPTIEGADGTLEEEHAEAVQPAPQQHSNHSR